MDRDSSPMHGVASFGPFRLFAAERQLKKGDEPLQLGGRALDTLIALVERAGEVVTQRELISHVWPDATVEEANLRVQIASLRKTLGDGRESARYIVTVPGRGYSFVAPVTLSTPQPSPSRETAVSGGLPRLPPKLTRMIGRDDAIRALSAKLTMGRFVSIVGAGGIGKTTVAISVAHMLLDDFNGAVFFVDLAALTDARLVPTTVARALGFIVQTQDPLGSLPTFIGDARILLVLDNCEHVIDSAALVAERVVGETPQVHVLTTSREALRVEGEHVHLLYALDCPPEGEGLTASGALAYPAVQLFMERAAASGHDAVLSDSDAPIVATICRRLDGIALAIELAASRAGSVGIRGVSELLNNRFSLVWHGRRTALPRHHTLNAMLDWSYNLLSPLEKTVFSRLSVFVGDFTLEAARYVASDPEMDEASATEAIASLLAKSLISKTELHGSTHYRLLETTRTFAEAKGAERGEANRVARRHAKFFSDFLQHDQLVQSRFGEHDLSGYAAHIGNVRAALQWAFSDDGNVILGVELAAWAAPLFVGLSLLEECTRWCERALELAYKTGVDPVELRLRNDTMTDPYTGRPFSTRAVRECLLQGAEKFGWARRNPKPRSMHENGWLIGQGVAAAVYTHWRWPGTTRAVMRRDGTVSVESGMHDIGTGTYTVMAQVAADELGLPPERVLVVLGDTRLPRSHSAIGSATMANAGGSVMLAARALRERFVALATTGPNAPFSGAPADAVTITDGKIGIAGQSKMLELTGLLARNNLQELSAIGDYNPEAEGPKAVFSFSAVFAEVRVDPDLGLVRLNRVVGGYDVGRVINPKTARSQAIGGVIWGTGQALLEQSEMDPSLARYVSRNLSGYLIPSNADIPAVDVLFCGKSDAEASPIGAKGMGELTAVSVAPAIANAVFHATGKRIRDLPITVEKLL